MKRDDEHLKRMERLRVILEDWATWQRTYRPRLGYPSRSLTCYSEGSTDFEGMCEEADSATYAAVDACVQDLVPAQRAAVMRRYGIAAVFRFPRDNYGACLLAAHERLMVELPKKGVIIA
jgi:hypothetical protein